MAIFDNDSSGGVNRTCPDHSMDTNASENFIGNLTFYRFNMILSGSCAAFATIVILTVMALHATHLSKPNEQIKIMKIAVVIPFYAIISLITICYPDSYDYLVPWLEFVQSLALGSFFLLMCEWVSPSSQQRDVFFAALRTERRRGKSKGGIVWYRRQWFFIFQYPVITLGCSIAADITEAVGIYCTESHKPWFAHIYINVVMKISTIIAIISVLRFYSALKKDIANHKPLAKLFAFKLIVGLTLIQGIVFMILTSSDTLTETDTLTYADVNVGIPSMVICLEMVLFSIFFLYAYDVRPYLLTDERAAPSRGEMEDGTAKPYVPTNYQGGPLGIHAWLVMWNQKEIIYAIIFGLRMRSESRRVNAEAGVDGLDDYRLSGQRVMR